MKAISTEQIRLMREQYKFDADLVCVLNEALEYREAEEEAANAELRASKDWCDPSHGSTPTPQGDGDPRPLTPLEVECGPSTIAMMMDHVDAKTRRLHAKAAQRKNKVQ